MDGSGENSKMNSDKNDCTHGSSSEDDLPDVRLGVSTETIREDCAFITDGLALKNDLTPDVESDDPAPSTLSPALTNILDDLYADLTRLEGVISANDYGPINASLKDLFSLLLDIVRTEISNPGLPDDARFAITDLLKGKLTYLFIFVKTPTPPNLTIMLCNIKPLISTERMPLFNQIEKDFLAASKKHKSDVDDFRPPATKKQARASKMLPNMPIAATSKRPNDSKLNSATHSTSQPGEVPAGPSGQAPVENPPMDTTAPIPKNVNASYAERIEPFYVKIDTDWKTFVTNLNAVLEEPVDAKLQGELVRLIVKNPTDFRALQKFVSSKNIEGFSNTPLEDRPRKVVIKGLPSTTLTRDIASELASLGYEVTQVVNMRHRTTKVPMPLFLADILPTPNFESILKVDSMLFMKINISVFYSKKPRQCYKCQRYGHSSLTCNFHPRCVKCAGPHDAKECLKPRSEKATCANCNKSHTANYSGCEMHPNNRYSTNYKAAALPALNSNSNSQHPSSKNIPAPKSQQPEFIPAPLPTPSQLGLTWSQRVNGTPAPLQQRAPPPSQDNNRIWATPQKIKEPQPARIQTPKPIETASSEDFVQTKKVDIRASGVNALPLGPAPSAPQPEEVEMCSYSETNILQPDTGSGDFFAVINEVRALSAEIDFSNMLSLVRKISNAMKAVTDPADKFLAMYTTIHAFYGNIPTPPTVNV